MFAKLAKFRLLRARRQAPDCGHIVPANGPDDWRRDGPRPAPDFIKPPSKCRIRPARLSGTAATPRRARGLVVDYYPVLRARHRMPPPNNAGRLLATAKGSA